MQIKNYKCPASMSEHFFLHVWTSIIVTTGHWPLHRATPVYCGPSSETPWQSLANRCTTKRLLNFLYEVVNDLHGITELSQNIWSNAKQNDRQLTCSNHDKNNHMEPFSISRASFLTTWNSMDLIESVNMAMLHCTCKGIVSTWEGEKQAW